MSAVGGGEVSAAEHVQRCWDALILRHGGPSPASAAVRDGLLCAYREPHRHYHTLDHIAALLMLLDSHISADIDRDALTLAILFHDIVYDPRRYDNEAASASVATKDLTGLGFSDDLADRVAGCILATRHAQDAPAPDDAGVALMLDLDLSILAAPRPAYCAYALAVRREYAHVPDALYRPARRRVLETFLSRPRIYRTARLQPLWEAPARANLAAEIAELDSRARR